MKYSRLIAIAALIVLTACSSSHRPTYSGVQESTEGVPGFKNGKKVSPHVKLGQSYTVDGETYVPRNQPDYVEVGMASWYGPGFHGGKTANGETFDSNELTGAHRTLPLPSIVRVTMVSTGKQAYVRINDRGPFAHSRILDLSRAAAEKIGLVRVGVAKVRIEYMKKESERFADLLEQGRDPKTIDLASEVIDYSPETGTQYARSDVRMPDYEAPATPARPAAKSESFWDNFGSSPANAAEPTPEAAIESLKENPISSETNAAAPLSDIASNDLAAPKVAPRSQPFAKVAPPSAPTAPPKPTPAPVVAAANPPAGDDESPFAVLESAAGQPEPTAPPPVMETAALAPAPRPASPPANEPVGDRTYVQLGAFSNEANAERLISKYKDISGLQVIKKPNSTGQTLYHVRMGPYNTAQASMAALDKVSAAGADAKIVRE